MAIYVKRTTIVQAGLVGLLGGLGLAKFGYDANLQLVVVSFLLLPLMLRSKMAAIIPFIMIGLSIGLWRGAQMYDQLGNYTQFEDQRVTLVGKVQNDSVYEDRGQLEFLLGSIHEQESGVELPGTVSVRAIGAVSIERGDIVTSTAKLREGFGSRQGFMSFANVEVVSRDESALENFRSEYFAGVYTALPEPQASLGLGFLVGTRSLLPASLLLALSVTGLTHIVAVSGYNLTILVRLTRRLFAKRSAYLSLAASLGLILGFVLVTGLSPSIARATVVSGLALTSWYYGRSIKPTVLILCAAAITAMINPLYIWYDLGWYLSFAAFAGVLILAPLVQKRLFKKKPKILGQVMLETTCAQLMTLPIIAVIFGELSMISIVANLLVLPLIPFAMLATFVAGLAGMLIPQFSGWLAWPANVILTFIVDVVELMARVPWALKQVDMGWLQLWAVYLAVLVVMITLRHKLKKPLDGVEVIE